MKFQRLRPELQGIYHKLGHLNSGDLLIASKSWKVEVIWEGEDASLEMDGWNLLK